MLFDAERRYVTLCDPVRRCTTLAPRERDTIATQ